MNSAVPLPDWRITLTGEVEHPVEFTFDEILRMPKAIAAGTFECSGNGRSLLKERASGNPWTIGAAGNAVWGGVWLKDLLGVAGPKENARHVAFEGMDEPLGSAKIKFIRSVPLEKAITSTLLAYEMNGDPLPLEHGFPLRALPLGWFGANCTKWLNKITVLDRPYAGHYMDKVYRFFQKGQDPESGPPVTGIPLKSIITQPMPEETLSSGRIFVLGAAFGGDSPIAEVSVSVDDGATWYPAVFIGPHETHAWRQWQFIWEANRKGRFSILARATDSQGNHQPMNAQWNVLGYGNNGVREHAVTVHVT
jgi:DMSO/TMAO reductase YedYZ molybdopterin-dependent catalytic subunit